MKWSDALSNRACKTTEYFHSFDLDHDDIIYNSILEYPSIIDHDIMFAGICCAQLCRGSNLRPLESIVRRHHVP